MIITQRLSRRSNMSRIFTSTSTYLNANSVPASLTAVPLSMAAWIKMNTLGNVGYILTVGVLGGSLNRFDIRLSASNTVVAEVSDGAGSTGAVSVVTISDTNTWHLVTGVFTTDSNRSIQLDAAGKITGGVTRVPTIATTDSMRISNALNGFNPLLGAIAYVATWNMALADADITALLTKSPDQVQPANLVNMWGLLNNQSPEPDAGPANVSMTVNGGPAFSTDNPQIDFGPVVMPWVRA